MTTVLLIAPFVVSQVPTRKIHGEEGRVCSQFLGICLGGYAITFLVAPPVWCNISAWPALRCAKWKRPPDQTGASKFTCIVRIESASRERLLVAKKGQIGKEHGFFRRLSVKPAGTTSARLFNEC